MATGDFWDLTDPRRPKGIKDPAAVLDIPVDWTEWLADVEDTYASHTVSVTGGLVVDSSTESDGVVTIMLSGGTLHSMATMSCRIVTAAGRIDKRTFRLKIEAR